MRFHVQVTTAVEVVFADALHTDMGRGRTVEHGVWRIGTRLFERFVDKRLEPLSFGEAVESFRFGFEIADLARWGAVFSETAAYTSWRPRSKQIVSVGQLEWDVVKDLAAAEQLVHMKRALTSAIARLDDMKRKPRAFDRAAFAGTMATILAELEPEVVDASAPIP
jgi:hypothetical protein